MPHPAPSKTSAGFVELRHRTHGLSQRHRTVLVLVDGQRPLQEVMALAERAGAGAEHLQGLVALGLVHLPDAPVAHRNAGAPQAPPTTLSAGDLPVLSLRAGGDEQPGRSFGPQAALPTARSGTQPVVAAVAARTHAPRVPMAAAWEARVHPEPDARLPPVRAGSAFARAIPSRSGSSMHAHHDVPPDHRPAAPPDPPNPCASPLQPPWQAEATSPQVVNAASERPSLRISDVAAPLSSGGASGNALCTAAPPAPSPRAPMDPPLRRALPSAPPLGDDELVVRCARGLLHNAVTAEAPRCAAALLTRLQRADDVASLIDLVWELERQPRHVHRTHQQRLRLQHVRELLGMGNTLAEDDSDPPYTTW